MRSRDENKETAIRDRAIEMIARDGFDGLSMGKLARAAHVSPATIYIYYKNREDLLNKLYLHVQETFAVVTLDGFDPKLSFEQGLWIQWKNRLRFILKYPGYYQFYEQFRNSPLILHKEVKLSEFKENMKQFVMNAIARKEINPMEPEVFWALAYGSFYALVKFHLGGKTLMGNQFKMNEKSMKMAFDMVIKALKP